MATPVQAFIPQDEDDLAARVAGLDDAGRWSGSGGSTNASGPATRRVWRGFRPVSHTRCPRTGVPTASASARVPRPAVTPRRKSGPAPALAPLAADPDLEGGPTSAARVAGCGPLRGLGLSGHVAADQHARTAAADRASALQDNLKAGRREQVEGPGVPRHPVHAAALAAGPGATPLDLPTPAPPAARTGRLGRRSGAARCDLPAEPFEQAGGVRIRVRVPADDGVESVCQHDHAAGPPPGGGRGTARPGWDHGDATSVTGHVGRRTGF